MRAVLRDGSVFLLVFRRRTQSEKQNRHWHDCEVDDETAYGDWDSAEPSEQIAKDGGTYERHCWRGSRQRGQSAVAELHAENKTAQQKHDTVEADDGDAQGNDQRDVLTECRTRRGNRSGKKRQRHGVKQHHPIQSWGILRPKIVSPRRHKTEQEGDDHW